MKVECQNCHKVLNLPDEKLPIGKPFTFLCPYCKFKNTLTIPTAGEQAVTSSQTNDAKSVENQSNDNKNEINNSASTNIKRPAAAVENHFQIEDITSVSNINDVIEGLDSALVVYDDEKTSEFLAEKLKSLGYSPNIAVNIRDAAKHLKMGRYKVVLVQENYYGATLSSNQLLRAIQNMDITHRRHMFIALLGNTFSTLDDLSAFSMSLDAVINLNELESIDRILLSSTKQTKKFYSGFFKALDKENHAE